MNIDLLLRIKIYSINLVFFIAIIIISLLGLWILFALNIIDYIENDFSLFHSSIFNVVLLLIPLSLFLNQDNMGGSGIIKRFFNIQIVSIKTNLPASSLRCFIRNISFFLIPLDFILWIYSPTRSIGDYLVGTKLIVNYSVKRGRFLPLKPFLSYLINSVIISLLIGGFLGIILSFISEDVHETKGEYYYEEFIDSSTVVKKTFFANGDLKLEYTLKDGNYEGLYKEYYENGFPQIEIAYVNGIREGTTKTFYSNGQKESEILYQNNTLKEIIGRWDVGGNLLKE